MAAWPDLSCEHSNIHIPMSTEYVQQFIKDTTLNLFNRRFVFSRSYELEQVSKNTHGGDGSACTSALDD
jgi:hypothetical protein